MIKKYLLAFLPLLFLAAPVSVYAAGPSFSGFTSLAKEVGGEMYGGSFASSGFYTDALAYLAAHPGSTITITGASVACYNVTEASFSGPSGDGGLNVDGFTSCPSDLTGVTISATINDPPPPPPPPPPSFDSMLTDANNGFGSSTGLTIDGVVSWAGDNLIKLFIGSGLAVLFNLRWWIAALVIIAALVYFAYRAFRFFRH
jgi:hypothetical protein